MVVENGDVEECVSSTFTVSVFNITLLVISNQFIMTAAHCTVNDKVKITALLGSVNRIDPDEGSIIITVDGTSVFYPPTVDNAKADIALIKLNDPISFSPNISPAIFSSTEEDLNPANRYQSIGWGITNEQDPNGQTCLQYIESDLLDHKTCMAAFLYKYIDIACGFFSKEQYLCNGDSGGPLLVKGTNRIVGIASFRMGKFCTLAGPIAFTNVVYYSKWISSVTGIEISN